MVTRHGGHSSAGRAPGCGPGCRGFESLWSPQSAKPRSIDRGFPGFDVCRRTADVVVSQAVGEADAAGAGGWYGMALPLTYSVHGRSQSVSPLFHFTWTSVPVTVTGVPTSRFCSIHMAF